MRVGSVRNLAIDTAVYKTDGRRTMSPEAVAERTLKALERGKKELTLSFPGRFLLLTNRIAPRFVDWGLGRWTRKLYADADANLERVAALMRLLNERRNQISFRDLFAAV